MSYQEREITKEKLGKHLRVLDTDEGIRIDSKTQHIFVNKTSNRYIINTSTNGVDQFIYQNNLEGVMNFLAKKIEPTSKIFA